MNKTNYSIFYGLLLVLILVTYLPTVSGGFFSDDYLYVESNPAIQSFNLYDIGSLLNNRLNPYEYLPVRDVSYIIDYSLFGNNPTGYHWHNILLYFLVCVVVFQFSQLLFLTFKPEQENNFIFAALATLLFASHPAHVESVAWISGRKDLLSGFFAFSTLCFFLHALRNERPGLHLLALLTFLLALFSKSTVIPLCAVITLITLAYLRRKGDQHYIRSSIQISFPYWLFAAAALFVHLSASRNTGVGLDEFQELSYQALGILEVVTNALKILGGQTLVSLYPNDLRLFYDITPPLTANTYLLTGLALLMFGGIACRKAIEKQSLGALGLLFFIMMTTPFLQIIPFNTWSLVSERFIFISVYGLIITATIYMCKNKNISLLIGVLVLGAFSYITIERNSVWGHANPAEYLYLDNLEHSPQHKVLVKNVVVTPYLKHSQFSQAQYITSRLPKGTLKDYLTTLIATQKAFEENDINNLKKLSSELSYFVKKRSSSYAQLLLGDIYLSFQNYFEAAKYYYFAHEYGKHSGAYPKLLNLQRIFSPEEQKMRQIIIENPRDVRAFLALGGLYLTTYQLDKAEATYLRIVSQVDRPDLMSTTYYNLGLTYEKQEEHEKSIESFQRAIDLGMVNANIFNHLGLAWMAAGEPSKAINMYKKAAEVDPIHYHALYNLGKLLVAQKRIDEAVNAFKQAAERMARQNISTTAVEKMIDNISLL